MTETVSDSASERCVRCPYSQSSTAEVLVVACPSDQPSQLGHCPLIYTPDTVLLPRALSLKGLLRDPRGAGKEILIFVPHSWRRRLMRRGMSNCHGGSLCHPLLNWTSSITATNAGQMFWQVTNCFPAQPHSLPTFFSPVSQLLPTQMLPEQPECPLHGALMGWWVCTEAHFLPLDF